MEDVGKTLAKKNILITGGTSALGSAFVEQGLREGARVFFTYHQNSAQAEALEKHGAKGFVLDLSSTAEMDDFAAGLRSRIKQLDALIHNAAATRDRTILHLAEDEWDYVIRVNLKAPYYLTKKLLPMFLEKKAEGRRTGPARKIFMITSRMAVIGGYGISNYAAAKGGLVGLTKSLAKELAKRKILVNAVNPGFMKSRMTEQAPPEVIAENVKRSPLGRYSDPQEVANFLVYLCSDSMTQVTGQVIHFEHRGIPW